MTNRVLLVDDNPSNLLVFEEILSGINICCIKANSAHEAISILSSDEVDLILLDVQMPEVDGFDTLIEIRKNDKWKYIPVILISAVYKTDLYQVKGLELGAIDFIIKPVVKELLVAKVLTFLELYKYRKQQDQKLANMSSKLEMTEIIENENLILNAANSIFQNINKATSELSEAEFILKTLQNLTDSKYGFLGEFTENNGIRPVSSYELPTESEKLCTDSLVKLLNGFINRLDLTNIIESRTSIVCNRDEYHEDLLDLKSFSTYLAVPIINKDELNGILLLANKPIGYDKKDIENIEILSAVIGEAFFRKKIEQELDLYKQDLRKMVEDRTRELKIKNKQLIEEKKERKAATDILNSSPAVAFRWKNIYDTSIDYVSENVKEISGYSVDEIINNKVGIISLVHPEDIERVTSEVIGFIKDKNRINFAHKPFRILKKNGDVMWADERIVLTRDKTGFVTDFKGIILDISDKINAENEMHKLSTAIEQIATSVIITDTDGNIEYVNPYFSEITGYSEKEVNGKSPNFLKSGNTSDHEYKLLWNTISSGKTWYGEFLNIKKNGDTFWESAVIAPVVNNNGKIINYIALKQDISQQKKTEDELEARTNSLLESQDLFKTLSEASFESIFLSEEGLCITQNKTAEKMFGYTIEEAIGKPGTEWIVQEDRDIVTENMLRGYSKSYIVRALRKDGTTFPCEIKGSMSTFKGKPVRITSLSDISVRVDAQKKLIESEKRYRSLLEDNLSIIMLFNPKTGVIVEVNNACCNFYGYTRDEMLKMKIFDINILSKREVDKEISKALSGNQNYFVFKHILSDEKIKDVEIYAGKVIFGKNEMILSVIHDITEKVRNSKELIISKEKAEESDRLKTAFLANMSHEIRTPMNAILGFSQLLGMPGLEKEQVSNYVETITNSGKQLLGLIDDIISISQIEAGIIDINYENTSINYLLKSVYKLFTLLADQKGINFRFENKLPDNFVSISTDPRRIQQVLINLLNNAFKFTTKGTIRFGCSLVDNNVEFFISDTGIGINESDEKIIFERFMQVHKSNDVIYGGTGIGLSISQAIVDKLGGKIWVERKEEEGAEFRFTITAVKQYQEVNDENKDIITQIPDFKNKTILVAEDEEYNFQLLEILLSQTGAGIIKARNGIEAVKVFNKNDNIDIILMDIKMPLKNGIDATIEIRKTNKVIPIIAQTAYAQVGDKDRIIEAGCNDYIAKPIQRDDLYEILYKYLTINK
jgi:PAS domain S-box-containing protein